MNTILRSALAAVAAIGLIVACIALAPAPARAQARGMMTWSGNVDSDVVITIHGRYAHTGRISGRETTHIDTYFNRTLPDRPVRVYLEHWQGRGSVRVIQQPRPENGFTAKVEITDPQSGRGYYRFTLGWTPVGRAFGPRFHRDRGRRF